MNTYMICNLLGNKTFLIEKVASKGRIVLGILKSDAHKVDKEYPFRLFFNMLVSIYSPIL